MIIRRKRFVRIGETYFEETPDGGSVDIVRWNQAPVPRECGLFGGCSEFHTLIIDLTQPEETLFHAMQKTTQNEVRRAAREDVRCEIRHHPHEQFLNSFSDFYDAFAAQKHLPKSNRARLKAIAAEGRLSLSRASLNSEDLVWHAYYRAPLRTRQLHSASLFRAQDAADARKLVSRANRLLHWADIKAFKAEGLAWFDFGGWYAGTTNAELLAINRFKQSFGGKVWKEFNCTWGLTTVGKLALLANRFSEQLEPRLRRHAADVVERGV